MKTTATIAKVRGYFNNDLYSLRLEMTESTIPCFRYDEQGELVESTTTALYVPTVVLLGQLNTADARFATWFGKRRDAAIGSREHPFAPSVAEAMLVGASLEIESTEHQVGDTYTDDKGAECIYKTRGFTHKIVGVTFDAAVNIRLNKYIPRDRESLLDEIL